MILQNNQNIGTLKLQKTK